VNEHPATPRDNLPQLLPTIIRAVEWLLAWEQAWQHCEQRGWCDGIGSHEFRRLTALAFDQAVQPYQCAMRVWIRMYANLPPAPNLNQGAWDREDT